MIKYVCELEIGFILNVYIYIHFTPSWGYVPVSLGRGFQEPGVALTPVSPHPPPPHPGTASSVDLR